MATVLVVHDDPFSLRLVGKILAREGHACVHAADEVEAWKVIRQNPFVDLIVLDDEAAVSRGEHFFRSLRDDLVLQGIPVVVFVAQAERTTIFRYAELGVQALLAKPYKGEALLEEVNRTKKADWTARIIEPEATVSARLRLPPGDYYTLLSAVAKNIDEGLAEFRAVPIKNHEDVRVRRFLRTLLNQSNELGLAGLKLVAGALARSLNSVDDAGVRRAMAGAESMSACLQARVRKYLGVHNAPVTADPFQVDADVSRERSGSEWDHNSGSFAALTTKNPLGAYGGHLGKLGTMRLLSDHDLSVHVSNLSQTGVLAEVLKMIRIIWEAPSAAREEALTLVDSEPGFRDVYLKVALRLGEWGEDGELETGTALDWLGIDRTLVLLSLARFSRATALKTPLNLDPLRRHTLLLVLLGYEFGTMLRLRDHHLPAAMGFGWNLGCWLLALAEPTAYGLALAEATATHAKSKTVETALFGYDADEIGRQFLAASCPQVWMKEAMAWKAGKPDALSAAVVGGTCVMQVAEPLAWAVLAGPSAVEKVAQDLKSVDHVVWTRMREAGLALPMDAAELAAHMVKEVETAQWVVTTFVEWAEAARQK